MGSLRKGVITLNGFQVEKLHTWTHAQFGYADYHSICLGSNNLTMATPHLPCFLGRRRGLERFSLDGRWVTLGAADVEGRLVTHGRAHAQEALVAGGTCSTKADVGFSSSRQL